MRNIDRVKVRLGFYEAYISHIDRSQGQDSIYHTYIDSILAFLPFDLAIYMD